MFNMGMWGNPMMAGGMRNVMAANAVARVSMGAAMTRNPNARRAVMVLFLFLL